VAPFDPPGIPFFFDSLRFVGFLQFRHRRALCRDLRVIQSGS
jgi:hypothetical protein